MHFTLATSIVALAVLAAAAPQPAKKRGGMAIPIAKRSALVNDDKTANVDAIVAHVASVEAKFQRGFENFEKNTGKKHPSAKSNGVGKRGAGDALTDSNNGELWYGTIEVGTPPKAFIVDFDTGSSDLFLPSSSCDSSCDGHTLWDPSSSSTSRDLGRIVDLKYGDGNSTTVEEYSDTVSIAGYSATGQTLGAATSYSGFDGSYYAPDGLMGMGFQSISVYKASPVFQTLVSEGRVDPVFSFKLSSSGSELYIGGSNSEMYTGSFTYAPVTQEGYWLVDMDGVRGNGTTILNSHTTDYLQVVVDTGTTAIIGIMKDVEFLHESLGGTYYENGLFTFPCDSFPTISFVFAGRAFPISPSTLNFGPTPANSSQCISGIAGSYSNSFWILGDVFLRSVYTAYDVGKLRVGFAQLA